MALRYGFFDSEITGYDEEGMPQFDRAESSDFLAMFLSCLIRSGVLAIPGDCFQVLAGEGMTVRIRPGFGVVEGRFAYDDEESSMALEAADTQNRRIDRVILRADYPDRRCEILIRAGTPATDPQPPELVRDGADYFELCLAEVAVRANQTVITQADITDTRADTTVCGWVTQNIDQVDTSTLFLQWQDAYRQFYADSSAEFDVWMAEMESQLGDSVVVTLMAAIDSLKNAKADKITVENLQERLKDKADEATVKVMQESLEKKAGRSSVHQIVIPVSAWTGAAAPYINTISVTDVGADSIVEVGLSKDADTDQARAFMCGQFADGGQSAGNITLRAYGQKPDIDIPVVVIVRGDA